MPDTRRVDILQEMESVFGSLTGTPNGLTFGKVFSTDYEGQEVKKGQNVISILDGPESYIELISPNKLDRRLEVELRARVYVSIGTPIRTGALLALGDLEWVIDQNNLWNGLALGSFFQSNDYERFNEADRNVDLSLFFTVQYRTARSDPTSL